MAEDEHSALARENVELRKRHVLVTWAVGSWVVATVIFCAWTTPLNAEHAGDSGFGAADLFLAAWVGGIAYLALFGLAFQRDDEPSTRKLLIVSAVIPTACLIAGFALASEHQQFDRGLKAFAAYTGRFPRNALGEPHIVSNRSSIVTACARQLRTRDTHFCVETITQPKFKPRGDYVITGGFRFRQRDQPPGAPSDLIFHAFDCSGEVEECE